jgi:hypothetical protein
MHDGLPFAGRGLFRALAPCHATMPRPAASAAASQKPGKRKARRMKIETAAKFIFGFIGIALLTLCCVLLYNRLAFIASAQRVQGEVTDLQHLRSTNKNNTDGTWRPIVQFRAPSGALVDVTTSSSSSSPGYEIGDTVDVFVPPSNPEKAMVNGLFEMWGPAAISGTISAVFLFFAWLIRRIGKDEKAEA